MTRSTCLALIASFAFGGCWCPTDAERPLPGPVQEAYVGGSEDGATRVLHAQALIDAPVDDVYHWVSDPDRCEMWLAEQVDGNPGAGGAVTFSWPSRGLVIQAQARPDPSRRRIDLDLAPYGGIGASRLSVAVDRSPSGWALVSIEQQPLPAGDHDVLALQQREYWSGALSVLREALFAARATRPVGAPTG